MMPAGLPAGNGGSGRGRPNIVLILADDLGYSDLGCYGGEIATPNLDRLAAGGLQFTRFYNAAICVPTRLSLLTGLYPQQAGTIRTELGRWNQGSGHVATAPLNERCVTMAEALRDGGYRTYMSGKWQLGTERPYFPIDRGFDRYFGSLTGGSNYFRLSPGRKMALEDQPFTPEGTDFYMTDAFTDYAVECLRDHGKNEEPFFLYLAYTAPHWPLHARPEDIQRYRGRFMDGWDRLREERYERMIEKGLLERRWPLTARDERAPPWSSVDDKEAEDLKMAVYAAQVDRMDQGIGRLLAMLDDQGKTENTLVLFLSDNGGAASNLFHRGEGKAARGIPPGPAESFTAYGLPWGNLSNTPFRMFKQWVHEGGIATPLIATWPAGIRQTGAITHQSGHIIDFMATFMDLAGINYPQSHRDHPIVPIEGKSLAPIFRGEEREGHAALFFEDYGNRAVIADQWKLVSRHADDVKHLERWEYPAKFHEGEWELYNLEADRTEMTNLADQNPEKGAKLASLYREWALRTGIAAKAG
jgi:arylsulfatase A-like enzyme